MRILIISFHYTPDLCAGSFRSTALVQQLCAQSNGDVEIDVITTVPNRYASYKIAAPAFEQSNGLTIHRIKLPAHRSGMMDQAKSFAYFAKEVNKLIKSKHYTLVYATSSRLMAAALGAWVARRQQAILYLDIRDLFVDTIKDVFSPALSKLTKPIFSAIEKWTFGRAQHINLVSKGFQSYIVKRYPRTPLSWHTNGIDSDFIDVIQDSTPVNSSALPTVLYAGNIGEGQGLHRIIPELANAFEGRAHFKLIGDGGRKSQLESAILAAQCTNVELLAPMNRQALCKAYQEADVLLLHLNDYDAFHNVLPSKIFEYAAMGKPIWAGVAGFSREFIQSEIDNAVVFDPCNVKQAIDSFAKLTLETRHREHFVKKYQREHIMRDMAAELLALI